MPPNGTRLTERPASPRSWTVRSRRSLLAHFSTAHGLMILAGLLTFVLVVSATKGSGTRLAVAVARNDIPAGAPVVVELLRKVDLPADGELSRSIVPWARIGAEDRVAANPIAAGEFLRPSDLASPPANGGSQLRAMSIPVKPERAVGGTLRVGDRVDVVDVVDGSARWVITGAQVIEVPSAPSSGGGLVRDVAGTYHVVIEVDAIQALALSEALTHDTVSVVRSTGAPPPPAWNPGFSPAPNAGSPPAPTPPTETTPTETAGGQTPPPTPGS